jgi:hypothetical protein
MQDWGSQQDLLNVCYQNPISTLPLLVKVDGNLENAKEGVEATLVFSARKRVTLLHKIALILHSQGQQPNLIDETSHKSNIGKTGNK